MPMRSMVLVIAALVSAPLQVLPGDSGAWRQAAPGYSFEFPRDHAAHPEYRIEWWYYTGNLHGTAGARYGYQLTFFRVGIDPKPVNPSRWAVRDLYMAHLAVTDVSGKRYRFAERTNRAGPGWAGAATDKYRVWNGPWEAALSGGEHRLVASTDDIGIDLRLAPGKPEVLHGKRGYSRKGSAAGNASEYYSLTRMPTEGILSLEGKKIAVSGLSWMDHEFGTSFLEAQQVGWDWFSIQLEDGRELMLFRLRRADGRPDMRSSATVVERGGEPTVLSPEEFELIPARTWTSPATGGRYPVEWRIRIPGRGFDLRARAVLDSQELRTERSTGVAYWEGAVDVEGAGPAGPVRGAGYLEMTGYAGPPISSRFDQ